MIFVHKSSEQDNYAKNKFNVTEKPKDNSFFLETYTSYSYRHDEQLSITQKSRKLIFGSIIFPPPRPLPLPPFLAPLPLPRELICLKLLPCFISTRECSNSSHRMQPWCKVAPSSRGVVFLLKSTSMIEESHSGHRSLVVEIL